MKHWTFRFVITAIVILLASPTIIYAKILVKGNIVQFTQDRKSKKKDRSPINKLTQFHIELKVPQIETLSATNIGKPSLYSFREVKQGLTVFISKKETFAVILTYFCSRQLMDEGAPYTCDSRAFAVDASGYALGTEIKGNFSKVEIHDDKAYYLLLQDTCCYGKQGIVLARKDSKVLCKTEYHRDLDWTKGTHFSCLNEETHTTTRIPLVD